LNSQKALSVKVLGSKLHYTLYLIQNERALGLEIKVSRKKLECQAYTFDKALKERLRNRRAFPSG